MLSHRMQLKHSCWNSNLTKIQDIWQNHWCQIVGNIVPDSIPPAHYLVINLPPFPLPIPLITCLLLEAYKGNLNHKFSLVPISTWHILPHNIILSKTPLHFCPISLTFLTIYTLLTFLTKISTPYLHFWHTNGSADCCFSPICIFHSQRGFISLPIYIYRYMIYIYLNVVSFCRENPMHLWRTQPFLEYPSQTMLLLLH